MSKIRLTQYSHGAGCGCKLSPQVLSKILKKEEAYPDAKLLVGNNTRDDAAAYDLGDGRALLSTTDFFMPIVDDPYTFGQIAASNAISDIYAMGGGPTMALGILGWPIDKLGAEVAAEVMAGARERCRAAKIPLAGGHSIDSPEPIFGLSVNGLVPIKNLKSNAGAKAGDFLFLSKALGVGILSTAEKRGSLQEKHRGIAAASMIRLNHVGETLAKNKNIHAMTDVTGFGLLGHLKEMCEGSSLAAELNFEATPLLEGVQSYAEQGIRSGGGQRNWESYKHFVSKIPESKRDILCDPQTSGGLLIAVDPKDSLQVAELVEFDAIGRLNKGHPRIRVLD